MVAKVSNPQRALLFLVVCNLQGSKPRRFCQCGFRSRMGGQGSIPQSKVVVPMGAGFRSRWGSNPTRGFRSRWGSNPTPGVSIPRVRTRLLGFRSRWGSNPTPGFRSVGFEPDSWVARGFDPGIPSDPEYRPQGVDPKGCGAEAPSSGGFDP